MLRQARRIRPEHVIALRGRIKYFQRMGFPAANPGRGKKTGYSVEEVLQFALAFAFLDSGMSPLRSARAVRTNWFFNRAAFAGALRGDGLYFVMFPRALDELVEEAGGVDDPISDPIGLLNSAALCEVFTDRLLALPRSNASQGIAQSNQAKGQMLVVDPMVLLGNVEAALAAEGVAGEDFRAEILALC